MERTTDGNTQLAEVCALAWQFMDDGAADGYESALQQAHRQVDELLTFAADWDAQAEPDPTPPTPDPVYVPSALDPHEARAVDKALYMRASGIVPRLIGRHWFVPSRTQGGVIYRTTEHECTCEAGQHGRYCWHRALIGIERELAA